MHQLFALLSPQRSVPALGGWAVAPDLALHLVRHLIDKRPRVVLECGSGASTLLMALAVDRYDLPTRVVSLDHDPAYAVATRQLLAAHGVEHVAEVRTAPLVPPPLDGHTTPWYELTVFSDVTRVDLLVVDGPPNAVGPDVRYPAVPLLRKRLAPGATVLLDDYVRAQEKAVAARWVSETPGAVLETIPLHKGLAVLSLPDGDGSSRS